MANPETEIKQDVLDDITDLLGHPRRLVARGSSLPSEVFEAAAARIGVSGNSMPEINEAIIVRAGLPYYQAYDSRGSVSGGGSTVTLEGLQALREALQLLIH